MKTKKKKFECISGLIEILVDPCVIHRYTGSQKFTSPGGLFPLQFVFKTPSPHPEYNVKLLWQRHGLVYIYNRERKKTGARETHTKVEAPVRPVSVRQCSSVPANFSIGATNGEI